MKKIIFLSLLSSAVWASKSDNISACVNAAKQYAGIELNAFEASYQSGLTSFKTVNTVKWPNAVCEVKIMGKVYNLTIDGQSYIIKGFAGPEAYQTYQTLEKDTQTAIQNLQAQIKRIKQGIDLLERQVNKTSEALQKPHPDIEAIQKEVRANIQKAYQTFLITPDNSQK